MKRFISVILLSSLFALPVMAVKKAGPDLRGDNLIIAKERSELARNPSAHGLYFVRSDGGVTLLADSRQLAEKLKNVGNDLHVAQFRPSGEWAYVKPIDEGALETMKRFHVASLETVNPYWERMRVVNPTTCAQQWGRICEQEGAIHYDEAHEATAATPLLRF